MLSNRERGGARPEVAKLPGFCGVSGHPAATGKTGRL